MQSVHAVAAARDTWREAEQEDQTPARPRNKAHASSNDEGVPAQADESGFESDVA